MALSYVQYAGDGVTQTFAVPFPYLDKDHIEVRVSLDVHSFTWDDPNTVRITPAPAPDAVIEVRRHTPRDNRMVDFVDGSVLTESDLDLSNLQTFYIVQEAIDIAGGTLELLSDGSYGAGGRRIKELGNPVEDRDAVTKTWAETAMSSQLAQAIAAANSASASKTVAATSEANTLAHRNAAETAKTAAEAARDTAATAATTATSGAGTATSKAAEAIAAATRAQEWASKLGSPVEGADYSAKKHAQDAAASAAAAAMFDPSSFYTKLAADERYYDKTTADGRYIRSTGNGSITGDFSVGGSLTFTKSLRLTQNTDLDTLTVPGWYDGDALLSVPVEAGVAGRWFYIEVVRHSSSANYVLQRITALNHSGYRTWVRTRNNGVWQPWREAWDSGNLDTWAMQPIGMPIPIFDHIPGVPTPPTDKAYRYVKLTAGLTGAGGYNNGILTSETVSGSAPLVNATAVVSLTGSPLNGQTLRLINTERRFVRAGDIAGSVQDDAFQGHRHLPLNPSWPFMHRNGSENFSGGGAPLSSISTTGDPTTDGSSGAPRTSTETRPRNIWATYYMRIK
ncbi:Phage T7 tail fibre protein [Chelatococcus sambhunathii]|uniref:Phage T7 tail fibre protein n=1 Tax=Chelatococcus sambhunathii TaxID=363953 RepID=A0ABP2ACE8_9HYPH|nr:phage tail fiber protein [Chelatococcus sambhunathii]CUA90941.1 Phage T7 tail fibre protein [Chelatococcus sambhunathii]